MFSCLLVWLPDSLFCSPCGYLLLMSLPCVNPVMDKHLNQVWQSLLLFTKYLWLSTFWAPVRIAFIEPLVIGWSLRLVLDNELWAKVIGATSKLEHLIDGMKLSKDLLPSPMMASNISDRGYFISLHHRMKETWRRISSQPWWTCSRTRYVLLFQDTEILGLCVTAA